MNASTVLRFLIKPVLTLILILLPVIPVMSAPVVPMPTYSLRWFSLWRIIFEWVTPLVGVTYQWEWYSFAAFLVLIILIILVWARRGRYNAHG